MELIQHGIEFRPPAYWFDTFKATVGGVSSPGVARPALGPVTRRREVRQLTNRPQRPLVCVCVCVCVFFTVRQVVSTNYQPCTTDGVFEE